MAQFKLYTSYTSVLLSEYSEFNRPRQFVRMCQKTDKRNCLETSFSSNELRIWNHLCFTGEPVNVDEGRAANFRMRGYLNGALFKTSKSNYCICLPECKVSITFSHTKSMLTLHKLY